MNTTAARGETATIPVASIHVTEGFNPRRAFREDALNELIASIKADGLIQAITVRRLDDESYALTISRFQRYGGSALYFLGAGVITFLGWVASSALAGAVGNVLGDPRRYGLDFAFLGAFIGLLVPQLKNRGAWVSFGTAAIVAILVSQELPGKWHIIIAALLAAAAGVVVEIHEDRGALHNSGHGRSNLSHQD